MGGVIPSTTDGTCDKRDTHVWGPGQSCLLCSFKSRVEIDLIEKVESEQRHELSMRLSGEKAFRAEGTASAEALRQESV